MDLEEAAIIEDVLIMVPSEFSAVIRALLLRLLYYISLSCTGNIEWFAIP